MGDILVRVLLSVFLVSVCVAQSPPGNPQNRTVGNQEKNKGGLLGSTGDVLSGLLAQYDKTVLPSSVGGNEGMPTTVTVNMLIRDGSLNDAKMEFSTTVTLRLNWTDSRLAYPGSSRYPYLSLTDGSKLWTPDIFFSNEKSAHFHQVITPNVLYRIYPDGTVFMSTRLSLVLGCPMHFRWFPFDRQTCQIKLGSYAHTTSEVILHWQEQSPVQIGNVSVAQYHIENVTSRETTSTTSTGTYTALIIDVIFKRILCQYVAQYFIPTTVLVIIAWLTFWIHPDMITPRILLGLASLVTVYHLQTGFLVQLVTTSFGSAFAVWGQMCSLFIVLALIETVLVNVWNRRDVEVCQAMKNSDDVVFNSPSVVPLLATGTYAFARKGSFITRSDRIDAYCRIGFPLLFIAFNIAFWVTCLMW